MRYESREGSRGGLLILARRRAVESHGTESTTNGSGADGGLVQLGAVTMEASADSLAPSVYMLD